jgi:FAD binding domain
VTRSRGQAVGCGFPVPRWPRRGVFERIRILHVPTCATRPAIVSTVSAWTRLSNTGLRIPISSFGKSRFASTDRLCFHADAPGGTQGGRSMVAVPCCKTPVEGLPPGPALRARNAAGDALHVPNPCIKLIEKAPYCAIKLVVCDLGTYPGLITDRHSRVLDGDRQLISGPYAVGNDIASIMGGNYPGAGTEHCADTAVLLFSDVGLSGHRRLGAL